MSSRSAKRCVLVIWIMSLVVSLPHGLFHDTFEVQCQQTQSALQVGVEDRGAISGSSFTINDLGAVEMQASGSRFGDTNWSVPDSGTRLFTAM